MKTLLKFIGYILGFLVMAAALVALVLYIMGLGNGNSHGNIITTMTPVESSTPDPGGNTTIEDTQQNGTSSVTIGTPTPVPTPSPEVSAEPSPELTPEPTPEATPIPQSVEAGTPLGSGTISSNTGLWIELDAVWEAKAIDDEKAEVTVTANLRSYKLNTGTKKNGLVMIVDGESTSLDVEGLNIPEGGEITTELGKYSFEVDAPIGKISLIPIEVIFELGITYSGKQLDNITVSDDVQIKR